MAHSSRYDCTTRGSGRTSVEVDDNPIVVGLDEKGHRMFPIPIGRRRGVWEAVFRDPDVVVPNPQSVWIADRLTGAEIKFPSMPDARKYRHVSLIDILSRHFRCQEARPDVALSERGCLVWAPIQYCVILAAHVKDANW